jgi:hypothetical protein
MRVFDYFDKVYLINLDKRPDRLENFKKEVEKFNLGEFERISAVDGSLLDTSRYNSGLLSGELGLLLTNRLIFEDAIKNNYNKILIVEDDCCFRDEIKNFNELITYLPEDWDMFYMGGNHIRPPVKINEKIVKLYHTYAAQFVAFKKPMYPIIIDFINQYKEPIDVSYAELQKSKNVYCYSPGITTQLANFSNIQNAYTDYNWLIK